MSSVEHKVEMYKLAEKRHRQGKPSWQYTVRGFNSAERHFNDCLNGIYDLADWDRTWLA